MALGRTAIVLNIIPFVKCCGTVLVQWQDCLVIVLNLAVILRIWILLHLNVFEHHKKMIIAALLAFLVLSDAELSSGPNKL